MPKNNTTKNQLENETSNKNSKQLIIFGSLGLVLIISIGVIAVATFNSKDEQNDTSKTEQNSLESKDSLSPNSSMEDESEENESEENESSENSSGGTGSQTELNIEIKNDANPENKEGESSSNNFKDGTFSSTGNYQSPGGDESVEVSVNIENNKIQSVTTSSNAANSTSKRYQELFKEGVSGEVVGKELNEIDLSKVNGSSLTAIGFNAAIENIKNQAKN
jgi:uncharacterized protein with FMN-binding domain